VDSPVPFHELREGAARLLVPDVPRRKGPGTKGPWPFYNPTMAVNRDLAAIVLARWPRPIGSVLDGLAATGAWGIRMQLEAGAKHVVFNDWSPSATDLIRQNLRLNGLTGEVLTDDLRVLLRSVRYDFVDIDPFGPPTPFLEDFFTLASLGSGVGITATDTAVLCGTYPDACRRRYGARPLRCPQGAEIGLRILLGYCDRLAADHGKAIRPILSFAVEHFLRIYAVVEGRSARPSQALVRRAGQGEFVAAKRGDAEAIGPLWMRPLSDAALVRTMNPSNGTTAAAARLLSSLQEEAGFPPFFVTTDELAARTGGSPPKLERFLGDLRRAGYRAVRTYLHPRGVRTDAPFDIVLQAFHRQTTGSTDGSRPAN